jgi:hypothetical protein
MRTIGIIWLGAVLAAAGASGAAARPAAAGASPFEPPPQQEINHNSSRSNTSNGKEGLTAPAPGVAVTVTQGPYSQTQASNNGGVATFPYLANGAYELTVRPGKDVAIYVVGTTQLSCDTALVNGDTLRCALTIDSTPGTRLEAHLRTYDTTKRKAPGAAPKPKN